ncbi:MAG TPA: hypothetical protein VND43_08050 [Burkholderiales bacterium]|nr:hypothetical protein [Pseudomonadota bacterium]HVC50094.1 hypothetical protein [Burkholderiales bacterium]
MMLLGTLSPDGFIADLVTDYRGHPLDCLKSGFDSVSATVAVKTSAAHNLQLVRIVIVDFGSFSSPER